MKSRKIKSEIRSNKRRALCFWIQKSKQIMLYSYKNTNKLYILVRNGKRSYLKNSYLKLYKMVCLDINQYNSDSGSQNILWIIEGKTIFMVWTRVGTLDQNIHLVAFGQTIGTNSRMNKWRNIYQKLDSQLNLS